MEESVNSRRDALNSYLETLESYGANLALSERINGKWEGLSFLTLSKHILNLASQLKDEGLKPGDKIAFLSESSIDYIPFLFASAINGAITVPLDIKLSTAELATILAHSETKILVHSLEQTKTSSELASTVITLETSLVIRGTQNGLVEKSISAPRTLAEYKDSPATSPCLLIYTSGTTSAPKGVLLSIDNLASQFEGMPAELVFPNSRLLSVLPLSHMFNLTAELFALFRGGSIYYLNSLMPHELMEALQQNKITHLICVPLILETFKRAIERELQRSSHLKQRAFKGLQQLSSLLTTGAKRKLFAQIQEKFGGHLQYFVSGGAPLSVNTFIFFEQLGFHILQGYGMTETSPISTISPMNQRIAGSVGKPIPGVIVKIHNPNDLGLGEILVQGRNVMLGYYKNKIETDKMIQNDGWLHTGDVGYLNKNGHLFISGRLKSLIVLRSGKKVHPEEVELVLSKCSLIEEVCVFSYKTQDGITNEFHELVGAVIKPQQNIIENLNGDTDQIKKLLTDALAPLRRELSDYKWPQHMIIESCELPKSTTRKIKRSIIDKNYNLAELATK